MKATITALAAQVDALPEDWALVAVDANKRPIDAATGHLLSGWQLAGDTSRELLKHSGHVKAVGAIAGELSGGLLIVDFDGEQAGASLKRLTGFDEADLPPTVACTSGRPFRKKLFFRVADQDLWGMIASIGSGTKDLPDLEVLWSGRQGVVIGAHPMEGFGYRYLDGCSPDDLQVAEAPSWLVDPLICDTSSSNKELNVSGDLEELAKVLSFLKPEEFGDYPQWSVLGMACKIENDSEDCKELFREFSLKAPNYNEKVFERQWKHWASIDTFCKKKPGKRPKTIASFVPMAKNNGYKPRKAAKPSVDGDSLAAVVSAQTEDKRLEDVRKAPNLVNLLEFLRYQTKVRIRWNELKRCIVVDDDKVVEPTFAAVLLADQWKINAALKIAEVAVKSIAFENKYNPVREYFESLRVRQFEPVCDAQLADCFGFDPDDSLSIQLMRIQLRACVGRGMNPGTDTKMDTLLVLEGEQGLLKSTALEALSPDPSWYDETTRINFDSRDALSSLNSAFIYEFSEIEKILTTADVAQFKSWISRKVDKYVEKHEKVSLDHPRRCCLFGTTNSNSFLNDPTGARRFFICKTVRATDPALIKRLRDALWHQSMVELEDGLPSFLKNEDDLFKQGQERAQNATLSDPWEAELSSHLSFAKPEEFFPSSVLLKHLGRQTDKLTVHDSKRLASAMRRLGWQKTRQRMVGHSNPVDGYWLPLPKVVEYEDLDNIF